MDTLPLVILVIALTIGLGITAGSVDAIAVKADWANRRCEPLVVASGFMYKPNYEQRSSAEFAFDNLKFCTEKFVKHTVMEALSPVFSIFAPIVALAGGVNKIFGGLRQMLHNMYMRFLAIISKFYEIFERYILQASRVTQQLRSAFMKVNASLVAAVYASLSMLTAGYNAIKFITLVTKIILGVISGMSFALMFVLGPFMALIAEVTLYVTTAINIVIAREMPDGFQNNDYKPTEAFCFAPNTKIKISDGSLKSISELSAGEKLADDCGHVQGMLTFDASNVQLFDYQGILVSGEHLVFEEGKWLRVADSKSAIAVSTKVSRLFCPVTTSHKVPVICQEGTIIFADWEEMDDESISTWKNAVEKLLNTSEYNSAIGEVGGDVYIMCPTRGKIAIRDVQIGDYVDCINKKGLIATTSVVGIYKGDSTTLQSSSDIGYGVWKADAQQSWYKDNIRTYPGYKGIAYHLITESGTFLAIAANKMVHIRDFTEVGLHDLPKLTPQVVTKLNIQYSE
jgi:hypothetical protein